MKYKKVARVQSALAVVAAAFAALMLASQEARAATWKSLEPFVSKRADVERVLGRPTADRFAANGTLEFKVAEGKATVSFVTARFIAAKKLPAELEGTVLQIVVQHDGAADTPESMKLVNNSAYERQTSGPAQLFSNAEEGVAYTFVDSRLKTTRFFYSAAQFENLSKAKQP